MKQNFATNSENAWRPLWVPNVQAGLANLRFNLKLQSNLYNHVGCIIHRFSHNAVWDNGNLEQSIANLLLIQVAHFLLHRLTLH